MLFFTNPSATDGGPAPPAAPPASPTQPAALTSMFGMENSTGSTTEQVSLAFSGIQPNCKIRFSVKPSGGAYFVTNFLGAVGQTFFSGATVPINTNKHTLLVVDAVQIDNTSTLVSSIASFTFQCVIA
jgi:hypothetical protein